MCGLWKQKVFDWPDPCAEQLKESTTILNSCWLQNVFAWPGLCCGACWTPAAALQFRNQLHVLSVHTPGLGGCQGQGLALEKHHGHMEPQPCAWEAPLAWALGLTCIIKALVGARVLKSWVRAARSPWAAMGWSWVSLRAQPLGTPSVSVCVDGTEGGPGSGPGLLGPGCCSEMLPSCSVHSGSLWNISWGSYKALHFCHHCSQTSLFERHTGRVEKPRYEHMAEIRKSLILRHWAL